MSEFASKRQAQWDEFIKKRTQNEANYADMLQKQRKSPYAPIREYTQSLPDTLAEIVPSFYIPMEQQLEYPTQCEDEIAKYNEIVATVMKMQEDMMIIADEANRKFAEEVHM